MFFTHFILILIIFISALLLEIKSFFLFGLKLEKRGNKEINFISGTDLRKFFFLLSDKKGFD